jgi:hypothetical protein
MNVVNAVLVSLTISSWDLNRKDAKASAQATIDLEVKNDKLCRVRKSLLPRSDELRAVTSILSEARMFHYKNTLPWMQEGPRILLTSNFDDYTQKIREFRAALVPALKRLSDSYDGLKEEARLLLGKLYNPAEYPSAEKLVSRYGISLQVVPLPAATAFADLGLESEAAEELRKKLEADMQKTFQEANRRIWEELYVKLSNLVTRLGNQEERVRKDSLNSLIEMAELLPKLNITQDPGLTVMSQKLMDNLGKFKGMDISNSVATRQQAADSAASILQAMQGLRARSRGETYQQELRRAA